MSVRVSILALVGLGCSGSDRGTGCAVERLRGHGGGLQDAGGQTDGGPHHGTGPCAGASTDDASSPVTAPIESGGPIESGSDEAGFTASEDAGLEELDAQTSLDSASLPEAPAPVSSAGLSLKVVGNHLVDANTNVVRLLGVNRSGQEFKCIQSGSPGSLGWGIFDGPTDLSSVRTIASWKANAVRIPLNEDCWLGINGVSASYGGPAYQAAIAGYVNTIHQAGLYVILDLHWNAPGTVAAASQQPLPDADHAVDFWTSVATTFSSDPATVFDLYNEPFLYGSYLQDSNGDPWACWLDGCGLNQYLTGGEPLHPELLLESRRACRPW